MRLRGKRPGGAATLKQTDDERSADVKNPSDPANRSDTIINRGRDPFAKIQRISTHRTNLLPADNPP